MTPSSTSGNARASASSCHGHQRTRRQTIFASFAAGAIGSSARKSGHERESSNGTTRRAIAV